MCGIIGYTGNENAIPKLIEGLSSLEYRGYDSAGIAFFEEGSMNAIKAEGKLINLKERISGLKRHIDTMCGIGHTRWATHGEPSDVNSHPHGTDNLYIVHNGIIENYALIKEFLLGEGYDFVSDTDTEIAAKLLDYYYIRSSDPIEAISKTVEKLTGSYAIGVIFKGLEGSIYAFRKDNPLIVAPSEIGNFITSDISAVLKYTNKFYGMEQGEIAVVKGNHISFVSMDGHEIAKELNEAHWDVSSAEKGGFEHFMIKEIHEEPDVIKKTVRPRITSLGIDLGVKSLTDDRLRDFERIHIVACGTAYHAGLIGKHVMEKMARIPVNVYLASEFRYMDPILTKKDLVIIISQSGETADTLAALRLAKDKGIYTFGIVNVVGSAIAREADSVMYTYAGPEISVASTKAYAVQLASMYLIAIKLASVRGKISAVEEKRLADILSGDVPDKVGRAISMAPICEEAAKNSIKAHSIFYIGRGVDYAQSCEAALKAKEISYIHCEAYAAGELKHGTISLIEEGSPVVAFITSMSTMDKMISNIREVKSRGANVTLFVTEGVSVGEDIADSIISVPKTEEIFMPIMCAPLFQLIAYYMSYHLGIDVDKPRNLAKSVTVE